MAKEYVKTKEASIQEGYYIPEPDQRGISPGYMRLTDFNEASKYLDPALESLMQFSTFPMSRIDPGGTYRFGSGNAGAPAVSWVADTATGRYLIGVSNPGESVGGT